MSISSWTLRVEAEWNACDATRGPDFHFSTGDFDYIREGGELDLEPVNRLIESNQLMAYKCEGFWRAMDILRDRQILEELIEGGEMPWRLSRPAQAAVGPMKALRLAGAGDRIALLCLGIHSDDIEIGLGGTVADPDGKGGYCWTSIGACSEDREREALACASDFLSEASSA